MSHLPVSNLSRRRTFKHAGGCLLGLLIAPTEIAARKKKVMCKCKKRCKAKPVATPTCEPYAAGCCISVLT